MASRRRIQKKKQPQIYPAGQKTGCCVAFAQPPHRVHRLSVMRLALPSRRLGTLRSVWQGIGGAGSVKRGRSVALHSVCGDSSPHRVNLWRYGTFWACSVAIFPHSVPHSAKHSVQRYKWPRQGVVLASRSVKLGLHTHPDTQNRTPAPLSGHFIATFCPRSRRKRTDTEPRRRGRAGGHLRLI